MARARFAASSGSAKVVRVFHEDAGAHEDGFSSKLHHERGVSGRGNASGREVRHRQLAGFRYHLDEFVGRGVFFGFGVEFFFAEDGEDFHLLHDLADVLDGVDYVAGAGLTFGADHGCAFGDAAQGFSEIARAADEWDFEGVLIDVVSFVGGSEDFGFVDVVDAEFLQDLRFGKMSDAALGHHGDRDGGHDLADFFGRGHACDSAFGADLRGDALEGHDGDGSGFFGDGGLLGGGDIHDDAAFEHFGEAGFEAEGCGGGVGAIGFGHGGLFSRSRRIGRLHSRRLFPFYSVFIIRGTPGVGQNEGSRKRCLE